MRLKDLLDEVEKNETETGSETTEVNEEVDTDSAEETYDEEGYTEEE